MRKKKTILITGGLGFIGSNIIRHLLTTTDYSFLIFDKFTYAGRPDNLPTDKTSRSRIRIAKGDILKRRQVEAAVKEVDCVLHLAADTYAARSIGHAYPTVLTNVLGTTILLESAVKYGNKRFILFSSSEVYGDQHPSLPMDELHPLNPVTPYAASKLAADRLAVSFFRSQGLPVTVLRPFNAYGAYQHPEKMVPLFITRLIAGKPLVLNHGGASQRDFVYVIDHARAVEMVLAAEETKVVGEVFNVGTGKATSIKDMATTICKIMGKNPQDWITLASSSKPETKGNVGISKKLHRTLGWSPSVTLEEGLRQTVDWYQNHQQWWDRS